MSKPDWVQHIKNQQASKNESVSEIIRTSMLIVPVLIFVGMLAYIGKHLPVEYISSSEDGFYAIVIDNVIIGRSTMDLSVKNEFSIFKKVSDERGTMLVFFDSYQIFVLKKNMLRSNWYRLF